MGIGVIFAIVALGLLIIGAKQAKKAAAEEKQRAERESKEGADRAQAPAASKPAQLSPSRLQPISSAEDKNDAVERARRELQTRLNEFKAKKAELEAAKSRLNDGRMTHSVAPHVTATAAAATARSHNEAHSDIVYKDHAKYRVEEVPVMNSIGGQSDEGCSEHYNLRYVKVDKPIIPEHLELTELQKCVVYGEIINQPAFKKSYRR